MLALVDRDDAHGGVDVDADEYMCGMDGGTAREREREREREKERPVFCKWSNRAENRKKYPPFLETFFVDVFFLRGREKVHTKK